MQVSNQYDLDEDIEKKSFDFHLFRRMMKYINAYKKIIAMIAVIMLIGLGVGLIDPLLIRYVIDVGIAQKDIPLIMRVSFLILGLYLINFICQFIRIRLINKASQGLIYDIRKEVFEHIQSLSFRFFDGRPAGKIISRVTNDVQAISEFVNGGVISFISETFAVIGILVIIFTINFKLALVTIFVIPFFALIVTRLRKKSENAWTETRKTVANINANLNESLQGIRVIHAFSRQDHNIEKFEQINKENYKANLRAIILQMLYGPLVELIGMIGTCGVIWLGARQVVTGEMSVGTIVAFVNYLWRFWAPLSALSNVYNQALSAMASSERLFQVLDTPPEIIDSPDAVELTDIKGDIHFDHVTFGYKPEERMVLHDISFEARPGQIIALVGPTGAGKSSIINLLMRFYEPNEGGIYVDGHDLRDVKSASFRNKVGMVLQDSFIFSGTIRENIQYGKLDATEEEILKAAQATRVQDFAEKFPAGFETEVEERGAKLSAGQRQLLAFARALVANPRILILDEATSSVDTETERHIQEALKTLFSGRTSIVIAHRLSTIEHADKIIVIDDGKIIEQGTHSELLNKKGMYHELYQKQFKDEEETVATVA
jgi:ATP-binding cassette, subfamily B, multidrug efflux pump